MTTLAQGDLPRDPGVLQTIARHNRFDIPGLGPSSCVGVYALVTTGGTRARRRSRSRSRDDRVRPQPARLLRGRARVGARRARPGRRDLVLARHVEQLPDHDRRRPHRREHRHVVRGPHPQAQLRRGQHGADALHRPHPEPHRPHRRHRPLPRRRDAARRAGEHRRVPGRRRRASTACASAGRCRSSPTSWASPASPAATTSSSRRSRSPPSPTSCSTIASRSSAAAGGSSASACPAARPSTRSSSGCPTTASRSSATSSPRSSATSRTSSRCAATGCATPWRSPTPCRTSSTSNPRCSCSATTARCAAGHTVRAECERIRDATRYVHDATVAAMNDGKDVWTAMREITLPDDARRRRGVRPRRLERAARSGSRTRVGSTSTRPSTLYGAAARTRRARDRRARGRRRRRRRPRRRARRRPTRWRAVRLCELALAVDADDTSARCARVPPRARAAARRARPRQLLDCTRWLEGEIRSATNRIDRRGAGGGMSEAHGAVVRIDDLRAPRLDAGQQAALDYVAYARPRASTRSGCSPKRAPGPAATTSATRASAPGCGR